MLKKSFLQKTASVIAEVIPKLYGKRYSRMDQVKFAEDSL